MDGWRGCAAGIPPRHPRGDLSREMPSQPLWLLFPWGFLRLGWDLCSGIVLRGGWAGLGCIPGDALGHGAP